MSNIQSVISSGGSLISLYGKVSTDAGGAKQIQQTDGIEELASTGSRVSLKTGPYQIDLSKGHIVLRESSSGGAVDLRDGASWKANGEKVPALVGQEQPYTMELPTEFGKPPVKITVESTKNGQTGKWEASEVTIVNGNEAVRITGVNTTDNVRIAEKTYSRGQQMDAAQADGATFQAGEHLKGFFVHDQYGTQFAATRANTSQTNTSLPVVAATVQHDGTASSASSTADAPKVTTSTNLLGKKTITIDDKNYTIVADESKQSVTVTDKETGKSFEAWGDPHLKSNGEKVGDFKSDLMVQLPKGGSVIIKTLPASGDPKAALTYSSEVTFVKGSHAVSIEGLGKNDGKLRTGEITTTGGEQIFSNALRNKTDIHLRMGDDGHLYSTLHEAQNKDSRLTGDMLKELDNAALKRQAAAEKAAASAPAFNPMADYRTYANDNNRTYANDNQPAANDNVMNRYLSQMAEITRQYQDLIKRLQTAAAASNSQANGTFNTGDQCGSASVIPLNGIMNAGFPGYMPWSFGNNPQAQVA